jgi:hypothetical protein
MIANKSCNKGDNVRYRIVIIQIGARLVCEKNRNLDIWLWSEKISEL